MLRLCALALLIPAGLWTPEAYGQERTGHWPQWRGPNRDNRSADPGLLREWPEGGPPIAWDVKGIGGGIAAGAVAGGRVFTLGYIGDSEYVTALDERTGRRLWATRIGSTKGRVRSSSMRWIAQRTPTVDGDLLYAVRADGDLVTLRAETGKEVWRVRYVEQFNAEMPAYGFCDYPLVDGEKLIVCPYGNVAAVAALDKRTGRVIWQTPAPRVGPFGPYGGAVVTDGGGVRQYLVAFSKALHSFRARDGRRLWSHSRRASPGSIQRRTPIVRDHHVWGSPGGGRMIFLLELGNSGMDVVVEERYFTRLPQGYLQDCLLLVKDHFYSTDRGVVVSAHAMTGGEDGRLRLGLRGRATMTFADAHLYVHGYEGNIVLVEAISGKLKLKSRFQVTAWQRAGGATNPVVTGGRLYIRNEDRLLAYRVHAGATPAAPPRTIVFREPGDAREEQPAPPRAIFVPTPHDVVAKMLEVAEVAAADTVFDLGSGDGRIPIAAAKAHGCKGIGYEIDAKLVDLSRQNADKEGVRHRITIRHGDLFGAELANATVVAVYLPEEILARLTPQFLTLRPGARIVSHQFKIPGVEPDKTVTLESEEDGETHSIHVWTAPIGPPLKDGQSHFACRNCGVPVAGWPGCVTNCRHCRRSYTYPEEGGK